MGEQEDTDRFLALRHFFKSVGCCTTCSIAFAIAALERESGRKWEQSHVCPADCKSRATLAWARRPVHGK